MPNRILSHLSLRRPWHAQVNASTLRADLIAGLSGAAVVLPQGVAFALIAGLPPEYGLFTAIVVTIIAALWGSSRIMVSGPTTALSALVFVTLSEMADPGTAFYISLVLTLTFMVGILQLAAGLAGLGALIAFVSHSVIIGFTAAAALLIAVSQLPGVLGVVVERGGGVIQRLGHLAPSISEANGLALLIAAITLAVLLISNKIDKRIPAYVVALIVGSAAAYFLDAPAHGIMMFEPLASVTPSLTMPSFDPHLWGELLPGAAAVAFVGLLEAISIGKSLAQPRGHDYDSNQEIIGQGLSNTIGCFFQSYASSGSFTRSGLNVDSGAQTPIAAILSAIFLLLGLSVVAPLVSYVPVPAMAAIILYVAWRLINVAEIRHILHSGRDETLILACTFFTGIFSELDFAIFVGVIVSLSVFLNNSAHPLVIQGSPTDFMGKRVFKNSERHQLPVCPQIRNMRIEGPIFFASIEHLEAAFNRIEKRAKTLQACIVSLKGVGKIDLAGADFLIKQTQKARARGQDMHLVVADAGALATLERLNVTAVIGESNIHSHKTAAVAEAVIRADDAICKNCTLRLFQECCTKAGAPEALEQHQAKS